MTAFYMYISIIWFIPIMGWTLLNETKFKKNIVLGVTLPKEAHDDPEVVKELSAFKKKLLLVLFLLAVIGLVLFIPGLSGYKMTVWMTWVDLIIFLPYIPYLRSRSKLLALKEERGWKKENQKVYVDLKAADTGNWLSPLWFLPPAILSLLPLFFDQSGGPIYLICSVSCALFALSYRFLYRNKSEMIDGNTELTIALSRIRRYNWAKVWILMAWLMACLALSMWITLNNPALGYILLSVSTLLFCVLAIRLEFRMRALQEKLTKDSGGPDYIDEDRHWLGGFVYYNPDDRKTIINSRIGLNSTINLATPIGKILTLISLILILAMPCIGFMLDRVNVLPIDITDKQEVLEVSLGSKHLSIDKDSIEEVILLQELPEQLVRRFGTATDKLLEGSFSAKDYGSLRLLADPTAAPFILIKNKDGNWLINSRDPDMTLSIYQKIKQ